MSLFAANADKNAVPVTREMLSSRLKELTDPRKGVAIRIGHGAGYAQRGTVKLVVRQDDLEAVPDRKRREPPETTAATTVKADFEGELSITALEEFVKTYRRQEAPVRSERLRSVTARIEDIQKHLAVAQGDDFRNTMAMANGELRRLDQLDREIALDVLHNLNPGVSSPLYTVWRAMTHKSGGAP